MYSYHVKVPTFLPISGRRLSGRGEKMCTNVQKTGFVPWEGTLDELYHILSTIGASKRALSQNLFQHNMVHVESLQYCHKIDIEAFGQTYPDI